VIVVKFEVEISKEDLKKFWDKYITNEIEKGTIEEAQPMEIVEAFKEFFYVEFGGFGEELDLRDRVKIKLVEVKR
jgi:hypothetical protein